MHNTTTQSWGGGGGGVVSQARPFPFRSADCLGTASGRWSPKSHKALQQWARQLIRGSAPFPRPSLLKLAMQPTASVGSISLLRQRSTVGGTPLKRTRLGTKILSVVYTTKLKSLRGIL